MVKLQQFTVPTEGIRYQNPSINAFLDKEDLGKGTIYVTESLICWINSSNGEGFSIQYPKMTLHAISRDENIHTRHCLYVMVNGLLDDVEIEHKPSDDDEASSLDSTEIVTEVIFVPEDPEILETLYLSVTDCTLLHPDSGSEMSDEDDFEEFDDGAGGDYEDDDENGDGPMAPTNGDGDYGGRVLYRQPEPEEPGQFDDAED